MNKYLFIAGISLPLLLTACHEDELLTGGSEQSRHEEGVELKGIHAVIAGDGAPTRAAMGASTRADDDDDDPTKLSDHVGRYRNFVEDDELVFTTIRRTSQPIDDYWYSDIVYEFVTDLAAEKPEVYLQRNKSKGWTASSPTTPPERIYWSDATNGHTFVGYSEPHVAGFDWKVQEGQTTYYGSLGDPTATGTETTPAIIDYNHTATADDPTSGNDLIKADDILLTWSDEMVADNAVAYVDFYHGLALIRVQVTLTGFTAGTDYPDTRSIARNVIFKQMPTLYKWDQGSHDTQAVTIDDQAALTALYGSGVSYTQTKDVHFWCPRPDGDSPNKTGNVFTFYALAVPRTAVSGQQVEFTVNYPDAMQPSHSSDHTYRATLPDGVEFRAGHCTTININLNHANQRITIGAEYIEWQFDSQPDDGALKKNSTFLNSIDISKVTTANESGVTIDNATWLFKGASETVYDIYQNDGSFTRPYEIRTALQLLSFAKEVNTGSNTFEGKYIKLDAGLYLQASTTDTGLDWTGIGTAEHPFQGTFMGGMRRIKRLQGNALFGCIGAKGHVCQLLLEDVISIKTQRGALCDQNQGIIDACKVESRNDKRLIVHSQYSTANPTSDVADCAGALCGVNSGMIVGCYALGSFSAIATTIGGLVGQNTGSVVASYAAMETVTPDKLTNGTDGDGIDGSLFLVGGNSITTTVGGVTGAGTCQYSFYCKELIESTRTDDPATDKTDTAMQKPDFAGDKEASNVSTSNLNGAIHYWSSDAAASQWPAGFSQNQVFSPSYTDANHVTIQAVTLGEHLKGIEFMGRVSAFPIINEDAMK